MHIYLFKEVANIQVVSKEFKEIRKTTQHAAMELMSAVNLIYPPLSLDQNSRQRKSQRLHRMLRHQPPSPQDHWLCSGCMEKPENVAKVRRFLTTREENHCPYRDFGSCCLL
ncbi:hypothetical protein QTP88_010589 [Uroleucon formosanum]